MKKETLGAMIASLRKEHGMTQLELAERMGVTDKAVSKWERDLSCPDVASLPKLSEVLGVSVDELMQTKTNPKADGKADVRETVRLITRCVTLAMGVALVVLSVLKQIDLYSAAGMAGIALACTGIGAFLQD